MPGMVHAGTYSAVLSNLFACGADLFRAAEQDRPRLSLNQWTPHEAATSSRILPPYRRRDAVLLISLRRHRRDVGHAAE